SPPGESLSSSRPNLDPRPGIGKANRLVEQYGRTSCSAPSRGEGELAGCRLGNHDVPPLDRPLEDRPRMPLRCPRPSHWGRTAAQTSAVSGCRSAVSTAATRKDSVRCADFRDELSPYKLREDVPPVPVASDPPAPRLTPSLIAARATTIRTCPGRDGGLIRAA